MAQWITADIGPNTRRTPSHWQSAMTGGASTSNTCVETTPGNDQFPHLLDSQLSAPDNTPADSNTEPTVVFPLDLSKPQPLSKLTVQLQQQKPKRKQRDEEK